MGTKLKSTQWYMMLTLTRDITMPCGMDSATVTPEIWHIAYFYFFLKLKKKKPLTHDMYVSQFRLKGT